MPGKFILTLDTELAWGAFSKKALRRRKKQLASYRKNINELLKLLEKYQIKATWAFVGQLFLDGDELWHAKDILEKVRKISPPQEIASHTFSHSILGKSTKEETYSQIKKCIDLAKKEKISIKSLVFPRNNIAHIDVLRDLGIKSFRGYKKTKRFFCIFAQLFFLTPPVYSFKELINHNGVLEIPASMFLMSYDGPRRFIPSFVRRNRCKKGIEKAIAKDSIFHLWFHPFNLGSSKKMFKDLEYIFQLVKKNKITSLTMTDVVNCYE